MATTIIYGNHQLAFMAAIVENLCQSSTNISVQTVIWVANRDSPITDENGILAIGNNGNLMVLDGNGNAMWSSNASIFSINTTAMLMDTGNLILSSNDSVADTDKALWQSFDNPTDTFLPGMRVHTNA
ncbi:hypothetical protein ACSBR1_016202 [Camellia fascicularis]